MAKGPYSQTKWKGKLMYQCGACPYSTLVKEDIESHVRGHRDEPAAKAAGDNTDGKAE
jgi:hypothetical protein